MKLSIFPRDYNHLSVKRKFSVFQWLLSLVTAILLVLLWCVNLLPLKIKLRVGKFVGRCLYYIPNSRTGITDTNLKLCFPALDEPQRKAMILKVFENFGAGIIETAMSWWDRPEKIHALTEIRDGHVIDQAMEKGNGVLLLGAHVSTLDLCAVMATKHYSLYAIYRKQTNVVLNWVMTHGRSKSLSGLIPHTSLRTAAKTLKKGGIVWYSPDQDMGEDHSVYAPFFGQIAASVTATSKLVTLTGAEVAMMTSYRKQDDSGYVVEFLPMNASYPVKSEVENATIVNKLLEQGIKLAPTQYYWFHRRFKSQPGINKAQIYQ